MKKLNIGDTVQMDGECKCSPEPMPVLQRLRRDPEPIYYDIRDCYHRPSAVRRVFRDGRSAWVRNRYGYARRIHARDLTE
tara:strand:- start:671 stop:910 length:240 start_codon:yes stop_codon:yes gene_type:complete